MEQVLEKLCNIAQWKRLTNAQKHAMETAIRKCRYAIPRKMIHKEDGYYCPECVVRIVNDRYEYCPWCGQAIEE